MNILSDSNFSRRDLLKGGGALIVGFSMAGPVPAAAARGDVAGPPDPNTVDSWIAVHADNTATIYFGKCELGQGNTTGMLQIAGEELDLDLSQLRAAQLDTNVTPNQGATSSSSSIHRGGPQLRAAAAGPGSPERLKPMMRAPPPLSRSRRENGRSFWISVLIASLPQSLRFWRTPP